MNEQSDWIARHEYAEVEERFPDYADPFRKPRPAPAALPGDVPAWGADDPYAHIGPNGEGFNAD